MTTSAPQPYDKTPVPVSRVLVIGLDGATWTLLDPLIKSGDLPNLAKLVESGARGILKSTIPPVTASAWPSFYTGRTPGHHGVYDFRKRMGSESTKRKWVNQSDINGPTLWDIASAQGKTVGLINLPLTCPPVAVNGYMIGGMPVPPTRDEIGFPKGLIDEVIRETGGYVSDVDLLRGESPDVNDPEKCREFVEQVAEAVEVRGRAAEYLMEKYPKDFTYCVFVTPDRLSHLFWKILVSEPDDPPLADWELDLRDRMTDVFRRMDAVVGLLVRKMNENDLIVVMSDHGFGHLDEILKLNRLLCNLGYLKFKPEVEGGIKKKIGRMLPESIKKPLRAILGLNRKKKNNGDEEKETFDPYSLIDWPETSAYSGGSVEQGVFLNVDGREPEGTVLMGGEYHRVRDKLIEKLREYKHPDGTPMFDWVEPRENVYSGEYLENAPDIIFQLRGYSAVVGEDAEPPLIGPWSQPRAGYHRRDGILILRGSMIERGFELDMTGIENVAPTILTCWNLAADKGMDGKLIPDAVHPKYLEKYPERRESFEESKKDIDRDDDDDSETEDLLKGLGYLN